MKLRYALFATLLATTAHADPPTECPRLILFAKTNGYNFGRYWLCKSVNFAPELPYNVTCTIDENSYYDVGEYVQAKNKWWIYQSEPEYYDYFQTMQDGSCDSNGEKVKH